MKEQKQIMLPASIWRKLQQKATESGESLSYVLLEAVLVYLDQKEEQELEEFSAFEAYHEKYDRGWEEGYKAAFSFIEEQIGNFLNDWGKENMEVRK